MTFDAERRPRTVLAVLSGTLSCAVALGDEAPAGSSEAVSFSLCPESTGTQKIGETCDSGLSVAGAYIVARNGVVEPAVDISDGEVYIDPASEGSPVLTGRYAATLPSGERRAETFVAARCTNGAGSPEPADASAGASDAPDAPGPVDVADVPCAPTLVVEPPSYALMSKPSVPATVEIKVSNDGGAPLMVSSVSFPQPTTSFSIIGLPVLGDEIAPSESVTIRVRGSESTAGKYETILRIESNDPATPSFLVPMVLIVNDE